MHFPFDMGNSGFVVVQPFRCLGVYSLHLVEPGKDHSNHNSNCGLKKGV